MMSAAKCKGKRMNTCSSLAGRVNIRKSAGGWHIDNRGDQIQYRDNDVEGLPVGLLTIWNTGTSANGTFRVVLKHQPELKSQTSGSDIGESDLDIEFNLIVD